MLSLLTLLVLPLLVPADSVVCSSPPRPISSPTHADAVYFLFVIDNSWSEDKIAQQKSLYQMIACEIPRSPKYRVGTIYAYAPKRPADFVLDDKSLATADRFTTTFDDVIERSYLSRPLLTHDRSRCSRMHAVVEVMRLADFSYDSTVHTHYIFPTDDAEDDFVNDCDPAWTFKQSARNILKVATPNHLHLDIIRFGNASRWIQYGERVQLEDWSDGSINQRDISYLFARFLDGALTGDAVNDVIVFGTYGMKRSKRPDGVASFVTEPSPPPSSSTITTSTTSTTTTTATTTTVPSTTSAATTSVAAAATTPLPEEYGRKSTEDTSQVPVALQDLLEEILEDDAKTEDSHSDAKLRPRKSVNGTEEEPTTTTKTHTPSDGHRLFGYQLPFSTKVFYIIVILTTAVCILIVWMVCGLVFYCCYRDDDSLKKHDKKEAEAEDEMMLISGLGEENDFQKPSTVMISDHLRRVKEDKYNEEQLKSSESRGTITVEV